MISIQQEHPNYCKEEIYVLAEANVQEINVTREIKLKHNPNKEAFDFFIQQDMVRSVVVRDEYGVLRGYGVLVTTPNIIDMDVKVCTLQAAYVWPPYRGFTSLKLLAKLESIAKEVGADYYSCAVRLTSDYSKFLLRRGFKRDETFYVLKL